MATSTIASSTAPASNPREMSSAGRVPLFFNSDVVLGVVLPAAEMPETIFYRNGEADEMLYVHAGTGVCDTIFGPLKYGPGDYLVLPIGTTWRLAPDAGSPSGVLYWELLRDRGAEALSERLRPAPRACALQPARHPPAWEVGGPRR